MNNPMERRVKYSNMELGSDFELDLSGLCTTEDTIYSYLKDYHTLFLDSGRSALSILSLNLKQGTILLPSYICNSVINIYQSKTNLDFYNINKDFSIDLEDLESKINEQTTTVYLMHYFGKIQSQETINILYELQRKYKFLIIEDTTHSIFTKRRTIGDYCVCSLRKWFPVMDGAVLYSRQGFGGIEVEQIPIKTPSRKLEAMILKNFYLKKQVACNEIYRNIFQTEEIKFDNQKKIYQISHISRSLLEYFPIKKMCDTRKNNYNLLKNYLKGNYNIESILNEDDAVPLTYPIYIKNRDRFRQYLKEKHIYCAVHWPLKGSILENNKEANDIYKNIISLPIDQRYTNNHMDYLNTIINNFTSGNR